MIAVEDILDMTDLTAEEIAAIAEHEHSSEVNAAVLAQYLLEHHHGAARVQDMICDDIRAALHKGDLAHARELFATLRHFMTEHPEAAHGIRS
ncbi:hypothetical protein [Poseidonocella sp. HB161398]|uniref:hypothetical protein n=1 Tax=Poseidonocella sp. HB161398 TaxID=2320855 RepID=UPI001108B62A|nr:hypothetical protein [Poseidonocella sp. HB161398]